MEAAAAYEILGNTDKRDAFDTFGSKDDQNMGFDNYYEYEVRTDANLARATARARGRAAGKALSAADFYFFLLAGGRALDKCHVWAVCARARAGVFSFISLQRNTAILACSSPPLPSPLAAKRQQRQEGLLQRGGVRD